MIHRLNHIVLIKFLLLTITGAAQSDQVFSDQDFFKVVLSHHPLAKQADIQVEKGESKLRGARGNLDPKAFADVSQKYYSDEQYYSLIDAGLKIPTYVGVDFYGGLEQNTGTFLNPESNTSTDGLWYAGVSVPIGQGLLMDQRRAEIKRSKIYLESTEIKRVQLLNKLLFDAGKAYWYWFEKYYDVLVYEEAVRTSRDRLDGVKQSAQTGEAPYIDTLEAGIQLQNRMLNAQQAQLDYRNAKLVMESFLWADGLVPLELDSTRTPMIMENAYASAISEEPGIELQDLIVNHPELLTQQLKIKDFEVQQRWKREQLKPNLNLKYNLIAPNGNDPINQASLSNYQWGLQFSMPIFLRKERGELQMNKIRIMEAEFELQNKRARLLAQAESWLNSISTTRSQVNLYRNTVSDFQGLLNGEVRKFNLGESSLFMVNSREMGYISARLKYNKLVAKNRLAIIGTQYALGNLALEY